MGCACAAAAPCGAGTAAARAAFSLSSRGRLGFFCGAAAFSPPSATAAAPALGAAAGSPPSLKRSGLTRLRLRGGDGGSSISSPVFSISPCAAATTTPHLSGYRLICSSTARLCRHKCMYQAGPWRVP
jgi:hypothetical protein